MASTGTGRFFGNLEALRGVAALMVALFHVGQLQYSANGVSGRLIPSIGDPFSWPAQAARIIGNGPGAVIFFFVLSGFVLTKILHESTETTGAMTSRFFIGRLARIYPGAICAVGVFSIVYFATGRSITSPAEFMPSPLLQNFLLLRTTIDGVMWSLQLELIAAPLLLLVYLAWRRVGFRAILATYLVLLGLSFVGWWNHLIGPPGQFGQIYAFLSGMTVYLYAPDFLKHIKRPALWALAAATLFLLTRHIVGWSSYFTYFFEATFAASLVALTAFSIPAPEDSQLFRGLRFIGRVSFSFYLLHPLTLAFGPDLAPVFSAAVEAGAPPLALAATTFLISSIIILPLAWMQYRLIELPGIAIGKALLRQHRHHAFSDGGRRRNVKGSASASLRAASEGTYELPIIGVDERRISRRISDR